MVPPASPYSGSYTYSRPPQNTTEGRSDLSDLAEREREGGREREREGGREGEINIAIFILLVLSLSAI